MNKFKKIICTFFALLMVVSAGTVAVSAGSAYQTYVYDVYGEPHKVTLSEEKLIKTRDALRSLGNDEIAEAYAEAIDWVIEQRKTK